MSSLADSEIGRPVIVGNVEGTDSISVRLLEMGLTPGVEAKLIGTAPMGDPMEFEVRGYRLSLRRSEAKRVSIKGQ